MPTVSVTIPVANFWPSDEDYSARDRVMSALNALGFGSSVGCGGGRGAVDFSYRVTDASNATETVMRVVREHMPTAAPQVRVSE